MRHLPRALNRFLLFVIGLLLLVIGVSVALLPTFPQLRTYWGRYFGIARDWYRQTGDRFHLNEAISWLQIAWIAVALIVIILMLVWIFKQGGGKTDRVMQLESESTAGHATAETSLVNEILQAELADDRLISSVSTSAWTVKHEPAIKLKIVTTKGADLGQIHDSVAEAVKRLDSILGKTVPVLVYITSGWIQKKPTRTN